MTKLFFKFCFLTHKAVKQYCTRIFNVILIRINVKSTTIRTHASFWSLFIMCFPQLVKPCANSFSDRSFVVCCSNIVECPLIYIYSIICHLMLFKKRVKTHLYLKYFCKIDSYCIYIYLYYTYVFLQCVSTVIIVYIIISPTELVIFIYIGYLDFK